MKKRFRSFIQDSTPFQKITRQAKNTYLTKNRISLHRIAEIFLDEIQKNNIVEKAGAMAFSFVLSVFPAIIFIFTLIPHIPVDDLQEKVMFALKSLLPLSMYNGVASAIYDIIHIPHGGALSFGFAFATFAAMNGIMAMIASFNRCYRTTETRGYWRRALISLLILFLLFFITLIAILTALFTKQYLDQLHFSEQILFYVVLTLKRLFFFIVFFIAISLIYYIAPAISVRWRFFSAGSLIAALLVVIFTTGFSYYVNSFDSYHKIYGSIGAFIGTMLWFYAVSFVLLIGFEINASFDQAKREVARYRNRVH